MLRGKVVSHHMMGIALFLSIVLVWMLAPCSAQEVGVAKEKESITPQTDMLKSILENTKWGAADRPMEALYAVDQSLQQVRVKIKALRAALLGSASEAKQDELAKYLKVSEEMTKMKKALENIQVEMSGCKSMCARMEMAAAEGKTAPLSMEKTEDHSMKATKSVEQFNASLEELKKLAKDIKNTKLINLSDELTKDSEALSKAVKICTSCLQESAGVAAAPSEDVDEKVEKQKEEKELKEQK